MKIFSNLIFLMNCICYYETLLQKNIEFSPIYIEPMRSAEDAWYHPGLEIGAVVGHENLIESWELLHIQ